MGKREVRLYMGMRCKIWSRNCLLAVFFSPKLNILIAILFQIDII